MGDREERTGLCSRPDAHNRQKIQYICLDDACDLNRLLCRSCVKEIHLKHKVGIIDKLISPLNRLGMNSHTPNSEQHLAFFQEKIHAIEDEWEKLQELFIKNMEELRTGVLLQLQAIMKTFSSDEVDRVHDLMLSGTAEISEINDCVKMINFLDKDCMEDVEAVRQHAEKLTAHTVKYIKSASDKISLVFDKVQKGIKNNDFNSFAIRLKNKKEAQEEELKDAEAKKDEEKNDEKKQEGKKQEKKDEKGRKQETKTEDRKTDSKQKEEGKSKSKKEGKSKEKDESKQSQDEKPLGSLLLEQDDEESIIHSAKKSAPPKKDNEQPSKLTIGSSKKGIFIKHK